jgi:hypothetical protein
MTHYLRSCHRATYTFGLSKTRYFKHTQGVPHISPPKVRIPPLLNHCRHYVRHGRGEILDLVHVFIQLARLEQLRCSLPAQVERQLLMLYSNNTHID